MIDFFSEDKMMVYELEIINRFFMIIESLNCWVIAHRAKNPRGVMTHSISIINHAMLVLRLIDTEALGARNKDRAKERARILWERNPGFLKPPQNLREIRNDFEHFEERLDIWVTNNDSSNFIDLNVGSDYTTVGEKNEVFRHLEGSSLMFWGKQVDLMEVVEWVHGMCEEINKNSKEIELVFDQYKKELKDN